MDDDDLEDFGPVVMDSAHRFTAADIAPLILNLAEGILGAFHSTAVIAYNMAARHANYKAQQEQFREEAMLAIESITEEPSDG